MINKSGFSTDVGNPLFTYSLYRQKRNLKILIKNAWNTCKIDWVHEKYYIILQKNITLQEMIKKLIHNVEK